MSRKAKGSSPTPKSRSRNRGWTGWAQTFRATANGIRARISAAPKLVRAILGRDFDRGIRALQATDAEFTARSDASQQLGLSQSAAGAVAQILGEYQRTAQAARSNRWKWLKTGVVLFLAVGLLCGVLIGYLIRSLYLAALPASTLVLAVTTITSISAVFAWSAHRLSKVHALGVVFYLQYAMYILSNALIAGGIEGVAKKHIPDVVGLGMLFGSAGALCGGGLVALVGLAHLTPARRLYSHVRQHATGLVAATYLIDSAIAARSTSTKVGWRQRKRVVEKIEGGITLIERELPRSRTSGIAAVDKELATEAWRMAAQLRKLQLFYLLHAQPEGEEVRDRIISVATQMGTSKWVSMDKLERRPSAWERIRTPLVAALPVIGCHLLAGLVVWYAFSGRAGVASALTAVAKPAIALSTISAVLALLRAVTEPPK